MTYTFSPDWPHGHITRDGRRARIICTDRRSEWPIIGLVANPEKEFVQAYSIEGRAYPTTESHLDLLNSPAPKKRIRGWANIYSQTDISSIHSTREQADKQSGGRFGRPRLACIEIDVEEGHGL